MKKHLENLKEINEQIMPEPFANTKHRPIEGENHLRPDQDHYPILNENQPASSMTKFEMAVFMVVGHLYSNKGFDNSGFDEISECAIQQVKRTFKQLNELKKWQT